MDSSIRLQAALAKLGFASRRSAVEIIQAGRVRVNGKVVLLKGGRVDLDRDRITVDGQDGALPARVYFLLNKPKDAVCTVKDKYAARTVVDIAGSKDTRVYPVGRLDKDTTGLLLLTNDGELAYRLTHPKFGVEKIYNVTVSGYVSRSKIHSLEQGIMLEGRRTYPCKIRVAGQEGNETRLQIRLTEGRNRQIKKMFTAAGHPVLAIQRVGFGPLKLGELKEGRQRGLSAEEVAALKKCARTSLAGNERRDKKWEN